MKRQITIAGFSILIFAAVALMAANTQQDKGEKKGQQKEAKQKDKSGENDKESPGRRQSGQVGKDQDKQDQGKNEGKGNGNGNGNSDNNKNGNANNGNNGNGKGNNNGNGNDKDLTDLKWDRDNFKERSKVKNQDKVTICHKFNRDDEPAVTLRVSAHALKAHLNHGDVQGDCPTVTNSTKWSDKFLNRRTDYYNDLQRTNDQVIYSQSIRDYAIMRLTGARQQLVILQNSNAPAAEIQQKQVVVTELEQNVSLLETLIGVAANLVVNKLTN